MSTAPRAAFHVLYTGEVQGVGFRYTAHSIARHHGVAGWVRNLPDGRVEMFVEGRATDVEGILKAIRDHWGESISDEVIEPREVSAMYGFEVRR